MNSCNNESICILHYNFQCPLESTLSGKCEYYDNNINEYRVLWEKLYTIIISDIEEAKKEGDKKEIIQILENMGNVMIELKRELEKDKK